MHPEVALREKAQFLVFKALEACCLYGREEGKHVTTTVTQNCSAVELLALFACLS